MADIATFQALDIRIGTICAVAPLEGARRPAYRVEIDFGPLGKKVSTAQLTVLYAVTDLMGRQVVSVVNLPPRRVAGVVSEVLVLGVKAGGGTALLQPDRTVANGEQIY